MSDLFLPPLPPATPAVSDKNSSNEPGIHSLTPRLQGQNSGLTSRELLVQTPMVNQTLADEHQSKMSYTWSRDTDSVMSPFDEWADEYMMNNSIDPVAPEINFEEVARKENSTFTEKNLLSVPDKHIPNVGTPKSLCSNNSTQSLVDLDQSSQHRQISENKELSPQNPTENNLSPSFVTENQQTRKAGKEDEGCILIEDDQETDNKSSRKHKMHEILAPIKKCDPYIRNESPALSYKSHTPYSSIQSPSSLSRSSSVTFSDRSESVDENIRASSVESTCSNISGISSLNEDTLPSERLLRDIVRRYLKRKEDMKVVILNAKVAQKSYGSEKRFLCPPPCIYLLGPGWKAKQRRKLASSISSPVSPYSSSSSSSSPSHSSRGLKSTDVCVFMGIEGSGVELQQIHLDPLKQYGASKSLHTADSDKRKYFDIQVKMFYGDGSEIGSFRSKRIKVISKPSKKKQTVKNTDLCILSGSKVSLFNRFRAQTVSTRYLYVNNGGYSASATQWGAFSVYIVDDRGKESQQFEASDGYIHYGQTLKLVCSVTGVALPRLVIRKVDKKMAVLDTDEPISQLHKCALYLKDTDRQYLSLTQDKIIAFAAQPSAKHKGRDTLNDGSCWTIISTEKAEYCWCDSSLNLHNNNPVTPMPVPISLQVNGGGDVCMVEIIGEGFTPNLTVWFAQVEAVTYYRCQECLVAVVPEVSKINPNWKFVRKQIKVPLLLIREDGVIYPTRMNFHYNPEPGVRKVKHPSIREILKSKRPKLG